MSELTPEPVDQIAAALAAFQATMPTVPKKHTATVRSDKGASYSYTYADLADVSEAAMPLLAAQGLAFVTLPGRGELVGILLHKSGQSLTASLPISGSTPQQIGSSLTYMRRYLLGCMTGLVTDDDEDGQLASQRPKKKPTQETPTAAPASPTRRMSRPQRAPVAPPLEGEDAPLPESPYLDTKGPLAKAMFAALGDVGAVEREERLRYVSRVISRPISSSSEMTDADAEAVIAAAEADLKEQSEAIP